MADPKDPRGTGKFPVVGSKLGELLVRDSVISSQQLQRAEEERKKTGTRLGDTLIRLGFLAERELLDFLHNQFGVPAIKLEEFSIDPDVVKLVPRKTAEKHLLIPLNLVRAAQTIIIAMVDPTDMNAIQDVQAITNYKVEVVAATESAIRKAIECFYGQKNTFYDDVELDGGVAVETEEAEPEEKAGELEKASKEAPIIKIVDRIMVNAIRMGASDIHIEPFERSLRLRFRIDGVLYTQPSPPAAMARALVSRIKILAKLDISERRKTQDGRIKVRFGRGQEMEFRVSIMPSIFGEKVVLRLLDKSALQLDMTKLGFEDEPLSELRKAITSPFGIVLVTGPTGSGKTTTLYSALSELNKDDRNICTVEDPVEYQLPGIIQVQTNEDVGMNFAHVLRGFLRQDPDIIMVGEIRDFETAETAIKAALTGHLVLSTLHTNDAPSTVGRLLQMGIEPFLITAACRLIMAQRLVRKICAECKTLVVTNAQALGDLGVGGDIARRARVFRGVGCDNCNKSGYRGRIALYEVMPMGEPIKELILQGASATEIKAEAVRLGMKTLRQSGVEKILNGVTTIEEVMRVTAND